MSEIQANGVAVYVYRQGPTGLQFLQLRRSGKAAEYQHSWQVCYGGIEPGETAIKAALRELMEETGLSPVKMFQVEYLESFYFRPKDCVSVMPVFGVEVAADAPVTLNEEHDSHRWVPETQIPQQFMWRSQREALAILIEQVKNPGAAMQVLMIR